MERAPKSDAGRAGPDAKSMRLMPVTKSIAEHIRAIGFRVPLELRYADPQVVRRGFGVVVERIEWELRGKSPTVSCDVPSRRYDRGTVAYGTATGEKGWTLCGEHLAGR